eukprot:scaffold25783_cov118-Isochrysis_galbana.AAC.4
MPALEVRWSRKVSLLTPPGSVQRMPCKQACARPCKWSACTDAPVMETLGEGCARKTAGSKREIMYP